MRTIPTVYKGVTFRSRLEARYALALDQLGIEWTYETVGVQLGAFNFLPDFWLPLCRTFLEVKGPHKERSELVTKAQDDADY